MYLSTKQTGITVSNHVKHKTGMMLFLYVLPFLALTFIFSYYPLYGWVYSFFDYRPPLKLTQCDFVGFHWYEMLVSSPVQMKQILEVLSNTFAMSGLGILTSWLPMAFAILLSEFRSRRYKRCVQTLTTLPHFISWILIYSFGYSIFSSAGMVNHLLLSLKIIKDPIMFLQTDSNTWISMCLWILWKNLGWNAVLYLAAIAGIDQELYEAAKVDGAKRLGLIWHITVPSLLPTYFVLLLLSVANFLSNGFEQYFVFQNILFIPHGVHFSNYVQVLQIPGLLNAALISLARTVLGTVFPVLVSAFLGYMFTQEKMWSRRFWYRYILITMYFNAGLIPWYITMMNLGLTNNFLAQYHCAERRNHGIGNAYAFTLHDLT